MLCLSELSGFLVGGNRFEKICGKISPENSNRTPLPIETVGRGFLVSGWMCGGYTQNKRPRKVGVLCEA